MMLPNCDDAGFTGTRIGMTSFQQTTFGALLIVFRVTRLHNGLAEGADADAAEIAGDSGVQVLGYPSTHGPDRRALAHCHEIAQEPKPPLDRNRDIVQFRDVLFATPRGYWEERRSGTWATIRHARKVGVPIVIIWPDGTVRLEVEEEEE